MTKKVYRVRNWSEYNKGLVSRGSLTVWFNKEHIRSAEGTHGNQAYSNSLILCALTLRQLFHLPYRATEGFLRSLIQLNQLEIQAPDYSTLCRRAKDLKLVFPPQHNAAVQRNKIKKNPALIPRDELLIKLNSETWIMCNYGCNLNYNLP
ncbi:transposase [Legionella gratiana]|uniref:Transposase n=1 Tax=Legionella gratiana TaxID=45066 RepID=A0A378J5V0_9GAMM|nr:IS5/IS1182 family transposase [Legionella gratiana]KTD05875.1 transposase [Legionella gratiana]STX42297.1 transposase [Legionella gratiana]